MYQLDEFLNKLSAPALAAIAADLRLSCADPLELEPAHFIELQGWYQKVIALGKAKSKKFEAYLAYAEDLLAAEIRPELD
jgi:hypothetical protein